MKPTVTVPRNLLRKLIPLAARLGERDAALDISLTPELLILRHAKGCWEIPAVDAENVAGEITVRLSAVAFARLRKFPPDDPLPVSIDVAAGRIQFGSLSLPCLLSPPPIPEPAEVADSTDPFEVLALTRKYDPATSLPKDLQRLLEFSNREVDRRIRAAIAFLGPLGVPPETLRALCLERIYNGQRSFAPVDKRLLQQITKAWLELATLGVSPEDLKMLVMQAVQNAWKTTKVAK